MSSDSNELPDRSMLSKAATVCTKVPGVNFEIRGEGAGQFIYGHTGKHAFEISVADLAYFVEHWNNSDPENLDPPVFSEIVTSLELLEKYIVHWATSGAS